MGRVGSITAIFSLIAGIYGGWNFLSGKLEEHRTLDRLIASATLQLDTLDYAGAWRTLDQAAGIDANSARVQDLQENVAMRWLEDVHLTGNETFSEISDKVDPVLTRGIAAARSPQRQADLLAHLGWSYFLHSRDGPAGPDPEALYRRALEKDPKNPYAEAMWGHWVLWNGGAIAEADKHFNIALETREEVRPFVRMLQVGLLAERHSLPAAEEVVRIANAIREERGNVTISMRRSIADVYYEFTVPPNQAAGVLNALPPTENLATFEWLMRQPDPEAGNDATRAYIRSALLERAGKRSEALAAYRALQKQMGADASGPLQTATTQAITRLTRSAVSSR
jgi:tetratricopeptide (TPR) repeat protein